MDILEFLKNKGVKLTHCGNNEFMGVCPFCGGNDRFRVWIEEGREGLGRWACRKGEGRHPGFAGSEEFAYTGDLINLIMEMENLSYQETKKLLGLEKYSTKQWKQNQVKQKPLFAEEKPKNETWINQARKFVEDKAANLLNDDSKEWNGANCLAWLQNERCLSQATIKRFRLGLVTEFEAQPIGLWGLEPYTDRTGKTIDRLNFYRQNLIIPTWRIGGYIDRIKIRLSKPAASNQRYTTVRGSNDNIAVYNRPSSVYVVTESELDAILLAQECPDVCPICLGGAGKRPTKDMAEKITNGEICLLCLDSDKAGKDKLEYWLNTFKNSFAWRIPSAYGKDLTELEFNYRKGKCPASLKDFIKMGINNARSRTENKKPSHILSKAKVKNDTDNDNPKTDVDGETEYILCEAMKLMGDSGTSRERRGKLEELLNVAYESENVKPSVFVKAIKAIGELLKPDSDKAYKQ